MLLKSKFTLLYLVCLLSTSFGYGFPFDLSAQENYRKKPDHLVEQITNKLCNHEDVENDLAELEKLVKRADNLNLQSINNIKKFAKTMQKDFQKPDFFRSIEFKKAQLITEKIDTICIDTIERRSNLQVPYFSDYYDDSLEKYLADARSFIIDETKYATAFVFALSPCIHDLPKKYLKNFVEYAELLKETAPSS